MTRRYSGGCQCGAVRYYSDAEPLAAIHCYCRQCQRLTGAGHASSLALPTESVTITGALREYRLVADSGNTVVNAFCPTCGSPVLKHSAGHPGMRFFHAGSLDDPSLFEPERAVWVATRQPWDTVDARLRMS